MATRCPQCQAEVSVGAAFCAICGAGLAGGGGRPGAGAGGGDSPSLFELPASQRGRWVRVLTVLTLDAVLAGAGIAMIASYFEARAEAARPHAQALPPTVAERPPLTGEVEVAPPRVVRPGEPRPTPAAPAAEGPAQPAPSRPPVGKDRPAPGKPAGVDQQEKDVLGGLARRPDAGVAATPPAPGAPDAGGALLPPAPPPPLPPPVDPQVSPPDAGPAPEPPPEPDPTAAEQSLASGVQRTVEGHMGQVRRCWENAAKSSADTNLPEGLIEVEFAVRPSGDAAGVQIVQNVTGSDQLGACVVALVSSWQFPTHDGDPVVFVWPFLFKATR